MNEAHRKTSARLRLRWYTCRVLALCLSVTLACTIAEVALRVGGYRLGFANPFRLFYTPDPLLGWRGKPNFAAWFTGRDYDVFAAQNEDGFRRVEQPNKLSSAGRKVFVLGDSFAWGWGVGQGQVLTDRLAALLPGSRVQNFGLPGAGTVQEYVIFQKYAQAQVRPGDVVVLAFYGNDFGDNIGQWINGSLHAALRDGEICLVPPDGTWCPRGLRYKLMCWSYLCNFIGHGAESLKDLQKSWSERSAGRAPSAEGPRSPCTLPDDSLQITKFYLGAFQKACADRHAAFVAAYIPGQAELGEDQLLRDEVFTPEQQSVCRQVFFRCAAALQIETLDLLPRFLSAKAGGRCPRVTFLHDCHWNADGHAIAAEALAAFLAAHDNKAWLASAKPDGKCR